MLAKLRAKQGWQRLLAFVLMFAFASALVHVHPAAASDAAAAFSAAASHDAGHGSHDHGGTPDDQTASTHCGYCALAASKYFVPAQATAQFVGFSSIVTTSLLTSRLTSLARGDLFRPPIASVS